MVRQLKGKCLQDNQLVCKNPWASKANNLSNQFQFTNFMSKVKDKKKEMAKKMRSNESGAPGAKEAPENESNKFHGGDAKNMGEDRKERKFKLPAGGENKR